MLVVSEKRRAYLAKWREKNRAKVNAQQRAYTERNREVCLERSKACQKAKRAEYSAKVREWARANLDKVKVTRKKSYENNRGAALARTRRNMGNLLHKYWFSVAENAEVEAMYAFCRLFPDYVVDHIIPVKGKIVSGLHVLSNLQVIIVLENRKKGAKFDPEAHEIALEAIIFA